MKKTCCLILAAAMALSLAACGAKTTEEAEPQAPGAGMPDTGTVADALDEAEPEEETVDIVFTYYSFDDSVVTDGYLQSVLGANPDYINAVKYDDKHYVVTMPESKRKEVVDNINTKIKPELEEALATDQLAGIFTKIETDGLMREVKLYADKSKYDALGLSVLAAPVLVAMVADTVQAYNLIGVEERSCDLSIYDADTGDLIYTPD